MTFFHQFRFNFRCRAFLLLLVFGFAFFGCSGGGDSGDNQTVETGVIAFSLKIDGEGIQQEQRLSNGAQFDCEANGIALIEIIVYDEFDDVIAFGGPFECEAGEGIISGVEAGVDRTVEVLAKDGSGATIFRGEVTGIRVVAGQTTEVGPVTLFPVLNRPPVLDVIGPKNVSEGDPLEFTITAMDPDADNRLSFSASNLPPGAAFDPDANVFQWMTEFGDAGVYTVLFVVTDTGDPPLSDSETVTISVGDVNRPPVFEPIGDKIAKTGELLTFTISAEDPDGDMLTYQATNLPEENLFDPGTQTFAWIPEREDVGNYLVLFTVVDDGEPPESDTEAVTITVGATNRPPEFDPIGDRQVNEGELLEFQVTATDPDDDFLFYEATGLPEGSEFFPETQVFEWQTGFQDAGNYEVTFMVADDRDPPLSDSAVVIITVGQINRPPEFDPIGSVIGGVEGDPIQFRVTAEDPDGDDLAFRAENLPFGASFNSQTQTFFWSPGFQDAGSYPVTFVVVDNGDPPLSDEIQVVITVGDRNRAPTLTPVGDRLVNLADFIESTPFLEFTVSGSDPDGDDLIFSAENLPMGVESEATFDSATRTFSWLGITSSDLGRYQVRFTVTDNGSPPLSDFEDVTITVADNDPPFFISIGDITAGGGTIEVIESEGSPVALDVQASDPNEDLFTFGATGLPDGAAVDPATGTLSWEFPVEGTYEIRFIVTDDGVPTLSDTQTVNLIIEPESILF